MNDKSLPSRSIHLDFHTQPNVYDVGRDFDAAEFASTLEQSGVQQITVFAKCNLGCAYFPTKYGTIHPGLKFDMLGQMVEACHSRGIAVIAYFNAGLDHTAAIEHRDWCKLNENGQVYHLPDTTYFFRRMCLNSGYGQYLYGMVEEVLEKYDVDGIFLDCLQATPCYGIECVRGMKTRGTDLLNEKAVIQYTHDTMLDFVDRIKALVRQKRPGIKMIFNGMEYSIHESHIEIEVLPSGGWGYDYFPKAVRYARTLGIPFLTMTGRFNEGWGEFGGLRPRHSLRFDLYNSMANGGACSIGDHMHPRGRLEPAVYELVKETFDEVRQYDEWTVGATALADIAVIEPAMREFPLVPFDAMPVQGAVRMLSELKYQCDVVDDRHGLAGYKLVILPDHVLLDDSMAWKIKAHLARGGAIISSGHSGLTPTKSAFALPEYNLDYEGDSPHNYLYFQATDGMARDVARMPVTIYDFSILMRPRGQVDRLAELIAPYFNYNEWTWDQVAMYVPPDKGIDAPAAVRTGNLAHFSFKLFKGYLQHAIVDYKYLLRNVLEQLLPQPLLKTRGLPSFAQATVTRQKNRTLVHILTYVPEARGRMAVIEEPIIVNDVAISLRTDGGLFQKAYLAPSGELLPMVQQGHYVTITIPRVNGYQMVVFE